MKKTRAHFPRIGMIPFAGAGARDPLAFRHYDPDELVDGKPLRDHLRFSIAYWHSFRGAGSDPFGVGTIRRARLCLCRGPG